MHTLGLLPTQDSSHHQDYYMSYKLSFVTVSG